MNFWVLLGSLMRHKNCVPAWLHFYDDVKRKYYNTFVFNSFKVFDL